MTGADAWTQEQMIMSNQLISPPGLESRIPDHLTPDECVALWADLYDATEALVLAGLRREVGPDGDLRAAYREWYAQQMEEHDQAIFRMLQRLDQTWKDDGR